MRYSLLFCLPMATITTSAYATTYLTVEQAQQAIFPAQPLTPAFVTLTAAQIAAIQKKSGVNVRHAEVRVWKTADKQLFIADEVVGKHEFITFAVGLRADGSVKQIEILDYKESFGYQVREEPWRRQFIGKTSTAPLELGRDVTNISGATLSCRHVTDGIKRLLATYDIALAP